MSERKDEKWLDEHLQRAVDGTTPVFDAQAWKQKYHDKYQALLSRRQVAKRPSSRAILVRVVLASWPGRLAVAASVAVAVGLFVLSGDGHGPTPVPQPPAAQSPVRMMSMMSLRMAYERGGFDALDRQLRDTLDEFGPRSSSVPIRELFNM